MLWYSCNAISQNKILYIISVIFDGKSTLITNEIELIRKIKLSGLFKNYLKFGGNFDSTSKTKLELFNRRDQPSFSYLMKSDPTENSLCLFLINTLSNV